MKVWLPRLVAICTALGIIAVVTVLRNETRVTRLHQEDHVRAYEAWKAGRPKKVEANVMTVEELRERGLCNKFLPEC